MRVTIFCRYSIAFEVMLLFLVCYGFSFQSATVVLNDVKVSDR